jgi:hypothetical protein
VCVFFPIAVLRLDHFFIIFIFSFFSVSFHFCFFSPSLNPLPEIVVFTFSLSL